MPEVSDTIELTRSMSMAFTEQQLSRNGHRVIVKEALDFFQYIVGTEQSQVEDFCYLADLYASVKRYEENKKTLLLAQIKFPKNWLVPYYKRLGQYQAGKENEALYSLKESSRLAPLQSDPDWKMGQVYKSLGNVTMADHVKKQSEMKKAKRKAIVKAEVPAIFS